MVGGVILLLLQATSLWTNFSFPDDWVDAKLTSYDPHYAIDSPQRVRPIRRHVALIGPHDRFNFGDLLFEKVVSKLLVIRAGYSPEELVSVGMIPTNMSEYEGNPNIVSAKQAIAMSRQATVDGSQTGPFDLVYLGGEALGCRFSCGVARLKDEADRKLAEQHRVTDLDCAYLFPKNLLLPPEMLINATAYSDVARPRAVLNSAGGAGLTRKKNPGPCSDALDQADFMTFRDLRPGTTHRRFPEAQAKPDSAVMVDYLYRDVITAHAETGEVAEIIKKTSPHGYIAVQMKVSEEENYPVELGKALDTVWRNTNRTIVFFLAGSTPHHDSADYYVKIAQSMKAPSIIFETEKLWSVVALISRATAVISSSLHVRIMSFLHLRPRVTLCSGKNKHEAFVSIWDSEDSTNCLGFHEFELVWPTLAIALNTSSARAEQAVDRAKQQYLEGFDQWASMLNTTYQYNIRTE